MTPPIKISSDGNFHTLKGELIYIFKISYNDFKFAEAHVLYPIKEAFAYPASYSETAVITELMKIKDTFEEERPPYKFKWLNNNQLFPSQQNPPRKTLLPLTNNDV